MEEKRTSRSHFATTVVCFIVTAVTALIMLITALVVGLSYLTGSLILAAALLGIFFGVIAWIIYLLAIRDTLERLHEQIETVYEVAHAAQIAYKWIIDKFALFMSFGQK